MKRLGVREWKRLRRGGRCSINELRQSRIGYKRNRPLAEVIIIQSEDSRVCSEPEFVSAKAPRQVVIDKESASTPPLNPGVIEPSQRRKWGICSPALQNNRKF